MRLKGWTEAEAGSSWTELRTQGRTRTFVSQQGTNAGTLNARGYADMVQEFLKVSAGRFCRQTTAANLRCAGLIEGPEPDGKSRNMTANSTPRDWVEPLPRSDRANAAQRLTWWATGETSGAMLGQSFLRQVLATAKCGAMRDAEDTGQGAQPSTTFGPISRFPELAYEWANWVFSLAVRCNQDYKGQSGGPNRGTLTPVPFPSNENGRKATWTCDDRHGRRSSQSPA